MAVLSVKTANLHVPGCIELSFPLIMSFFERPALAFTGLRRVAAATKDEVPQNIRGARPHPTPAQLHRQWMTTGLLRRAQTPS
jgi:hypothetical protein